MLRVVLVWHLWVHIHFSSTACERASCEDQWREGVRLSRDRSSVNGNVGGNNLSTVPPAALHAALKDHWMEQYKLKLLKDLDMQSPPEPGSRRLPKSIRQQFERIRADEGETLREQFEECPPSSTKSEHVRDVIARGPKPSNKNRPHGWSVLNSRARPVKKVISSTLNTAEGRFVHDSMRSYFHLNGLRERIIKNATLYIHTRQPADIRRGDPIEEVQVRIYKYLNDAQIVAEPVATQAFKTDFRQGTWLSLDLTQVVHQWAKSPLKNYGIMVKAESDGHDYVNRTADEFNRTSAIILAMDVDETASSPSTVPPVEEPVCSQDDAEEKCCRYPLEVNFEAFGWDWVIAPKRYNAYYCAGACPVNYKQMSPHAHLMQQLDHVSSTDSQQQRRIGPCCTPQDYQDLKVLYIGQDRSIKETRIPAAIVLRCGCA